MNNPFDQYQNAFQSGGSFGLGIGQAMGGVGGNYGAQQLRSLQQAMAMSQSNNAYTPPPAAPDSRLLLLEDCE